MILLRSVFIIAIAVLCVGLIGLASNSAYAALQATIGSQGTGNGEFNQPWGLGINGTGWIFVAEYWNHRISLFDNSTDHNFSSHIVDPGIRENNCPHASNSMELRAGDPCEPDGFFDQPMDVEFDSSNNFWVLEVGNNRLQKFSQDGTFISKFGTPCTMNSAGTAPTGGVNGALSLHKAPLPPLPGTAPFITHAVPNFEMNVPC